MHNISYRLKKKLFQFYQKYLTENTLFVFWVGLLEKFRIDYSISFSTSGEDLILFHAIFQSKKNGFFIDVGANHPIKRNNTYKLYLNGWSGINIDANPQLIQRFKKIRKRDISLCEAVSNKVGEVDFFISSENAVSTISPLFLETLSPHYVYQSTEKRQTKTLEEIVDACQLIGKEIDLLCIDVEGHDLEVLQSNNFEKIRPRYIMIEDHVKMNQLDHAPIIQHLQLLNYELVAFVFPNLYFKDQFFVQNI